MPEYNVGQPAAAPQAWNLQVGPPGIEPNRPPASLALAGPSHEVAMGQQANIALNAGATAIITRHLANCSAFGILYRQGGHAWSRASLIHMLGGPDPNSVNWPAMVAAMPVVPNSVFFAVLANSSATVLTEAFLQAITANLPWILPARTWVYNQQRPAINFGLDFSAFAGEP
jgi:hypothetical protein